ncbi:FecCD family ABC transporter permease [Glutamicibacter sp.]|uniref:FecCD family ABC transporter permease n=1 Tax=Glutamicibacter sp. TaxID=1931995 RepID=UPI002B490E40|nr:iron ABC transporter permease [Glutamicibacter sp.]HJX79284.1 iron ABC transporter permease [Glutamicibacter sp.]
MTAIRTNTSVRWLPGMVTLALLLVAGSAFFGEYRVSLADFGNTMLGSPPAPMTEFFVMQRRIPRALVALMAGMLLAASGSLLQQLLRNPLASPDIIGITNGASLGGCVVILLLGGSLIDASIGALLGAFAAASILLVAVRVFRLNGTRLILLGVGLAALSTALVNYMLTQVFVPSAQIAQTWLVGTLQGRGWSELPWLVLGVALLVLVQLCFDRELRMLAMGDDLAAALGVNVARIRAVLFAAAAVLAALAVLCTGPIGFVALVAPHISHSLTGSRNLLVCALTGGILLMLSDLVAQYALPVALPVGVVTIIFGGGFFLGLLFRQGRVRG